MRYQSIVFPAVLVVNHENSMSAVELVAFSLLIYYLNNYFLVELEICLCNVHFDLQFSLPCYVFLLYIWSST